MAVAQVPILAEPVQHQPQRARPQIGKRFVAQEQEAAVIDNQRQTSPALLLTPADPAVAGTQPAGGGAKNQRSQPAALSIGQSIKELLADRAPVPCLSHRSTKEL